MEIDATIDGVLEGRLPLCAFPPIEIVWFQGQLFTLSNRRLFMFRVLASLGATTSVQTLPATPERLTQKQWCSRLGCCASKFERSFSTSNGGCIVIALSRYAHLQVRNQDRELPDVCAPHIEGVNGMPWPGSHTGSRLSWEDRGSRKLPRALVDAAAKCPTHVVEHKDTVTAAEHVHQCPAAGKRLDEQFGSQAETTSTNFSVVDGGRKLQSDLGQPLCLASTHLIATWTETRATGEGAAKLDSGRHANKSDVSLAKDTVQTVGTVVKGLVAPCKSTGSGTNRSSVFRPEAAAIRLSESGREQPKVGTSKWRKTSRQPQRKSSPKIRVRVWDRCAGAWREKGTSDPKVVFGSYSTAETGESDCLSEVISMVATDKKTLELGEAVDAMSQTCKHSSLTYTKKLSTPSVVAEGKRAAHKMIENDDPELEILFGDFEELRQGPPSSQLSSEMLVKVDGAASSTKCKEAGQSAMPTAGLAPEHLDGRHLTEQGVETHVHGVNPSSEHLFQQATMPQTQGEGYTWVPVWVPAGPQAEARAHASTWQVRVASSEVSGCLNHPHSDQRHAWAVMLAHENAARLVSQPQSRTSLECPLPAADCGRKVMSIGHGQIEMAEPQRIPFEESGRANQQDNKSMTRQEEGRLLGNKATKGQYSCNAPELEPITTLAISNVPNHYTQELMVTELVE